MKTEYKNHAVKSTLAVRAGTTGDVAAIQKTVDNCNAKRIYLNELDLDGVKTQVVSIETSKDSDTYAHIALDTFLVSSIAKMYPRDATIGGRIAIDGTMLNGVVDSRAQAIRQILNGLEPTSQTNIVQHPLTSEELLKQSVLDAIEERLSGIRAFYLASLASLLTNPAQYLADNATKLDKIGNIKLTEFATPFDLPVERINALLQSEKYAAQLQTFKDELVCNKATTFRVHETFLVCDGMPTEEQKTVITAKGFLMYPKDTTALEFKVEQAMKNKNWTKARELTEKVIALQNTVEIRKPLTE